MKHPPSPRTAFPERIPDPLPLSRQTLLPGARSYNSAKNGGEVRAPLLYRTPRTRWPGASATKPAPPIGGAAAGQGLPFSPEAARTLAAAEDGEPVAILLGPAGAPIMARPASRGVAGSIGSQGDWDDPTETAAALAQAVGRYCSVLLLFGGESGNGSLAPRWSVMHRCAGVDGRWADIAPQLAQHWRTWGDVSAYISKHWDARIARVERGLKRRAIPAAKRAKIAEDEAAKAYAKGWANAMRSLSQRMAQAERKGSEYSLRLGIETCERLIERAKAHLEAIALKR